MAFIMAQVIQGRQEAVGPLGIDEILLKKHDPLLEQLLGELESDLQKAGPCWVKKTHLEKLWGHPES